MTLRHLLLAACVTSTLACIAEPSAPRGEEDLGEEQRVAWISANAVPVRSVDAADVDFSDLEPLRAAIGGARVVMLGEQTHGDGTAFAAKVRLIKFLHTEMDFDIIAFEAGMFDSRQAWTRILAGDPPMASAQASIFGIWSRAEEVRPLFEYIGAQAVSARPLELAGVDPQFTGPVGGGTGQFFAAALEAHLVAHSSTLMTALRWPEFREVANRIALQHYRDTPPTASELAAFDEIMPLLRAETARIRGASPSFATSYWNQLADALEAQGLAWWARAAGPPSSPAYSIIRDASMARNLAWMIESGYPGRKIIVWAHNGHIQSEGFSVRRLDGGFASDPNLRSLGDLTRERMLDDVYTIGFFAAGGRYGFAALQSGGPIPAPVAVSPPLDGSWEDLLMQVGPAHLFLDLRRTRQGAANWAREPLIAQPIFYVPMVAPWPRVYDAIFFSRLMAPATPSVDPRG